MRKRRRTDTCIEAAFVHISRRQQVAEEQMTQEINQLMANLEQQAQFFAMMGGGDQVTQGCFER
mgnify:CR=1 FL=1